MAVKTCLKNFELRRRDPTARLLQQIVYILGGPGTGKSVAARIASEVSRAPRKSRRETRRLDARPGRVAARHNA